MVVAVGGIYNLHHVKSEGELSGRGNDLSECVRGMGNVLHSAILVCYSESPLLYLTLSLTLSQNDCSENRLSE